MRTAQHWAIRVNVPQPLILKPLRILSPSPPLAAIELDIYLSASAYPSLYFYNTSLLCLSNSPPYSQIRGLRVYEALKMLEFSKKKAALPLRQLIYDVMDKAQDKVSDPENMYVLEAYVTKVCLRLKEKTCFLGAEASTQLHAPPFFCREKTEYLACTPPTEEDITASPRECLFLHCP